MAIVSLGAKLTHCLSKIFLIRQPWVGYWKGKFNILNKIKPDFTRLRKFKDLHKGERCFVIGNGPSLRETDLSLLKGEITFGVNGLFYFEDEFGFKPTYYVVEDSHVLEDNLDRINAYPVQAKFFPDRYVDVIEDRDNVYYLPTDWLFYWSNSPHFEKPRFSKDIAETIYTGQTVTYLNLQLAYYMGFKEIYLVGLDFDYKIPDDAAVEGCSIISASDDPNHFHPEYFGKGKKWHFPSLDNCLKSYKYSRAILEDAGRIIKNATIGGKLEAYERIDFGSLFSVYPRLQNPNSPFINYAHQACLLAVKNGWKLINAISKDQDYYKEVEKLKIAYAHHNAQQGILTILGKETEFTEVTHGNAVKELQNSAELASLLQANIYLYWHNNIVIFSLEKDNSFLKEISSLSLDFNIMNPSQLDLFNAADLIKNTVRRCEEYYINLAQYEGVSYDELSELGVSFFEACRQKQIAWAHIDNRLYFRF